MPRHLRLLRAALALVPFAALTFGVPLANRVDPTILGLPFILGWILAWIAATPFFMWGVGRIEGRW